MSELDDNFLDSLIRGHQIIEKISDLPDKEGLLERLRAEIDRVREISFLTEKIGAHFSIIDDDIARLTQIKFEPIHESFSYQAYAEKVWIHHFAQLYLSKLVLPRDS